MPLHSPPPHEWLHPNSHPSPKLDPKKKYKHSQALELSAPLQLGAAIIWAKLVDEASELGRRPAAHDLRA